MHATTETFAGVEVTTHVLSDRIHYEYFRALVLALLETA